jgi:hypothetical protein
MVGIPNHRRGPSRNQLLCLKLNFAAVKAPYLTPTQLGAMELQFKIAVKGTYEVIHAARGRQRRWRRRKQRRHRTLLRL